MTLTKKIKMQLVPYPLTFIIFVSKRRNQFKKFGIIIYRFFNCNAKFIIISLI